MSLYDSWSEAYINETIKHFYRHDYRNKSKKEYLYNPYTDDQRNGKTLKISSANSIFWYVLSLIPPIFLFLPNYHS